VGEKGKDSSGLLLDNKTTTEERSKIRAQESKRIGTLHRELFMIADREEGNFFPLWFSEREGKKEKKNRLGNTFIAPIELKETRKVINNRKKRREGKEGGENRRRRGEDGTSAAQTACPQVERESLGRSF